MLYGKQEIRKHIVETARNVAQKQGFLPVFGAAINSIGRGTYCYDSDYDIRFLYIRKDFPQKIYYPWLMKETEIKYFYEPEPPVPLYHHMSFWDFSAFLQLLVCPELKEEPYNKWGLYYIVKKVLLSPYAWDPFGLQMKITPLLEHKVYRMDYELYSHLDEWESRFSTEGEEVSLKNYILALYEAFAIKWVLEYQTPSPCNIMTLFAGAEQTGMVRKVQDLLELHRSLRAADSKLRNTLLTKRDEEADQFMIKTSEEAKKYLESFQAPAHFKQNASNAVDEIYQIINASITSPGIKDINN